LASESQVQQNHTYRVISVATVEAVKRKDRANHKTRNQYPRLFQRRVNYRFHLDDSAAGRRFSLRSLLWPRHPSQSPSLVLSPAKHQNIREHQQSRIVTAAVVLHFATSFQFWQYEPWSLTLESVHYVAKLVPQVLRMNPICNQLPLKPIYCTPEINTTQFNITVCRQMLQHTRDYWDSLRCWEPNRR
jgi:hypothetical protein